MPPNNNQYPQPQPQPPQVTSQPPQSPNQQFDSSQFDFMLNPQTSKKNPLSNMPKIRLGIMIAGIIVIAIILIIIMLNLFGSNDNSVEKLTIIAQQQNEIIRVSDDAVRKAGNEKTKKLAILTNTTIKTDQNKVVTYLAKNKKKLKAKQLNLLKNKETDAKLAAATQNGRYDEVVNRIIIEQLTNYQSSLERTFPQVGPKGQELLKESNANTLLILKDNKTTP